MVFNTLIEWLILFKVDNYFNWITKNIFRKDSPKFDGTSYDSWKEKMKTHLLCMGPGY